jgi:hypothetical protein
MIHPTLDDIARVVEYIPIAGTVPNSGLLIQGEIIDSDFLIKEIDSFPSKLGYQERDLSVLEIS